MVRTPMRERLLAMLGIAAGTGLLAVGLATMPAVAQSAVPDCGTGYELVAKFNYQGGGYVFEKPAGNEDVVTITNGTATGGDWESTQAIARIVVFGGNDAKFIEPTDPYEGEFDNVGLQAGGSDQTADISNVQFCKRTTTDTSNGNGNGNGTTPVTVTTPVIVTVTEPPTTTRPPVPFDEEPEPAVLPTTVVPEPTTTIAPATVAPATEAPTTTGAVLGVTVERQLPRTGAASTALAQVGFGLLLVGAGLLAHSRRVAYDER
jgi:LPXTG-motif cell wall-anchored protein